MALTKAFKATVVARAKRDAAFRKALLIEAIDCLLADDVETGKAMLRDYINATIGFEELSKATRKPAKSLMRMRGAAGNPQANNLVRDRQSPPEERGRAVEDKSGCGLARWHDRRVEASKGRERQEL